MTLPASGQPRPPVLTVTVPYAAYPNSPYALVAIKDISWIGQATFDFDVVNITVNSLIIRLNKYPTSLALPTTELKSLTFVIGLFYDRFYNQTS